LTEKQGRRFSHLRRTEALRENSKLTPAAPTAETLQSSSWTPSVWENVSAPGVESSGPEMLPAETSLSF
jgi:hypothetical protein